MKILADKNILSVENTFAQFGDLILLDGREITRKDLRDIDVLLVRSITRVNEELLAGSKVKFVGTATSGTDHIDLEYLENRKIFFADAKGSNANAVVDYCFSALAFAVINKGLNVETCEVGIVGAGKVGGLFSLKLDALGIRNRLCDPPLAQQQLLDYDQTNIRYHTLEETLQCDVISLHVPLNRTGSYSTVNMIGASQLQLLKHGALFINACRGEVVNENALSEFMKQRSDVSFVFDVWKGEPKVDRHIVEAVDIATPHIAGYSQEAKFSATELLRQGFLTHFNLTDTITIYKTEQEMLPLDVKEESTEHAWNVLLNAFPLEEISQNFKHAVSEGVGERVFDQIRQQLLSRREFKAIILNSHELTEKQQKNLNVLGFNIS
ncbi:MAG: 4-phosphoerythronate dehydrogenase [SAR86 cluster bacterium]|uniref:Erythronate-4-phosphate dehydrogenase n=1 Tax=SAR86 cluster bacterium TaxID=2030880 RepID=A0A2A5BAG4_9GAMM|nr:MAG: 4-phosphoerythronate dehydrogenase [SAR86 cluster bacterium]